MDIIDRFRKAKADRKLSDADLGELAGLPREKVNRLLNRRQRIHLDDADALARALGLTAMLDASESPATVPLRGHLAAGEWRQSLYWPRECWTEVSIYSSGPDLGVAVYRPSEILAWQQRGTEMDELIPPGSIVFAVAADRIAAPIRGGEVVVVERRRGADEFELSLRELQPDPESDDVWWLIPRSTDRRHQAIRIPSPAGLLAKGTRLEDDTEVRILGVRLYSLHFGFRPGEHPSRG